MYLRPPSTSPDGPIAGPIRPATRHTQLVALPERNGDSPRSATAIVYCEANFGAIDGKTANGLVRHSQRYHILSVIDSEKAGHDAGMVLDEEPNAIPMAAPFVASA